MKITFVVPTLNFTGGLRVIAIYADYLRRFGNDVTVVSPGIPKPTYTQSIKSFIKRKPWKGADGFSSIYFDSLDINLKLLDESRKIENSDLPDSDVVIATWWETALWVNDVSERKGKKVYFMQDYGDASSQPLDEIQRTWLLPFHIITISQWLKSLIVDYKKHSNDLTLISNGIDLGLFSGPERDKNTLPTIGFLYTDVVQKGADLAIQAFLKAKLLIPELRLIMFGSKDLPEKYSVISDLTYHQKLSDDKVASVYASCDAWIFASKREGFGLPILEAMASRTPVIATKAGASEELVNHSSGILLDSYNVGEMADAIVEIMNLDNDSWKQLSNGAYEVAKSRSWSVVAKKFENTLQLLCQDNSSL